MIVRKTLMRSRKPALSEAEGDPLSRRATGYHNCPALSSPSVGTSSAYGTLSLASSDRGLLFPRKSTADTE